MAKADLVTGLVVFVLGIYMIVEGLRLPGAGGFIEAGGEPGRVPIMLGAILALLALVMIARSIARGGHRLRGSLVPGLADLTGWVRSALAAFGCSVYAVGLLGAEVMGREVRYREATVLFVFLFITGFEWAQAPELWRSRRQRLWRRFPSITQAVARPLSFLPERWAPYLWLLCMATLQALLVAFAIGHLFEYEFYVKLP